jgi:L-ascorbate metabolism protein UlaG (beta-lactamase superfamily)
MSVKLVWHGHSAWTIDTGDYRIVLDPFFTGNPMADRSADEVAADFILVSHAHGDHIGDTVAIARRTGALVISNYEIACWCEAQGCKAHGMSIGGSFEFPFGRVKLTIAHHGSAFPDGSYGGSPAGFLIAVEGKTIYNAADTALFLDMQLIGEGFGGTGLDVALLPIGDNFTMGPEDALRAVQLLKPRLVIPMHYGTFGVIEQDAGAFASACEGMGVRCVALEAGGVLGV